MRRRTNIAVALVLAVMLLALSASCRTTAEIAEPGIPESGPESSPAPVPDPEPVTPAASWNIGDRGPDGGIVFECKESFIEAGEPVYEAGPYDEAVALVAEPWRIPDTAELQAMYTQLVESGLWDIGLDYFWSCDEMDDGSVAVMNFDTGFTGRFYRDMDFVGLIPVKDLR